MGTKSKWKNEVLRFYNDAVIDESVDQTTANGFLPGHGLSLISGVPGVTVGVFVLKPPVKGVTKQIVTQTSNIFYVRCSTVDNQVRIAAPTTTVNSIVLHPGSTYPVSVSLRGMSTVLWAVCGGGAIGTTLMTRGNHVLWCTGTTGLLAPGTPSSS